ncbi:MAG TPA: polysaccharide biosynthesis C-terminal domain-containing protein [Saprospiraceae bacterium]|nr:polysaccharide biosynthesis C-terminal domain-containing protein [Saprospiraceae bacterium]
MSFVKKLAGETIIYGMSSILPRVIHFLFLTIYITYKFEDTLQFGIYNELYAYSTILLVIFLFRMDTAFFRFGAQSSSQDQIFGAALLPVIGIAVLGSTTMYFFSDEIAIFLKYEYGGYYVRWFAFILGFDALAGMFYARFRLQSRPFRFLMFRMANVVITLLMVFLFLEIIPDQSNRWFDVQQPIDFVFLANLIGSAAVLLLMIPDVLKVDWQRIWKNNPVSWSKMFWYSLPLVLVGIAGNINQVFATPLQKFFLGGTFNENLTQAGAYMGPAKIALLLNLFTVAFNYAAEPFFFNNVGKENSEKAYGQIMHAFTVVSGVAMMAIISFQELAILLIGESYRGPQEIIPILLFAYFALGLYYNISIWYKLSDKTYFGAFISSGGAILTLGINIYFLPKIGYIASAWATLACFIFMTICGYILGQKFYPIRYPVKRIIYLAGVLFTVMIMTVWVKSNLSTDLHRLICGMVIFTLYIVFLWISEKKTMKEYLK